MSNKAAQLELIRLYFDGNATPEEVFSLESLLLNDSAFRFEFLRYAHLDAALMGTHGPEMAVELAKPDLTTFKEQTQSEKQAARTSHTRLFDRMLRRPLVAASLGILIGLISASVLWAFVVPTRRETINLLTEDFESQSLPLVRRVPLGVGIWRGDRANIVHEERGVKPASGNRMLRFIREGWEGKPRQSFSHIADVYHLMDIRELLRNTGDDPIVVHASASFNAIPFSADEEYGCSVSVYALDIDSDPKSATNVGIELTKNSTAMARSVRTVLDRNVSQWQYLDTELQLPPNTAYLVVRVHITQLLESYGKSPFDGAYVDDVKVSLRRRIPSL
ncbi:MAG: hypothetical protein ABL921_16220 [Pirellula sp.]